MKYRAVIQKVDDWWIGWLIDIPGVNAQEKTYKKLIDSLKIGAEDMLALEPEINADAYLKFIDIDIHLPKKYFQNMF
ncbi:MAG: type II toxin-antitoxin system HicB family antitoxin [Candidatus Cloacimonetes bacterium]|nr:type II toxin-antitoxin system HicB family antitoxin [Candidatus Cloacimonadota bacterium]MBL7086902.1 type II toxin-antitoxin system HicB family antitoxin [Candidatus Cloacimonadota bacterium]